MSISAFLEASKAYLGRIGGHLGCILGYLGGILEPFWEHIWGILDAFWAVLEASLEHFGNILGTCVGQNKWPSSPLEALNAKPTPSWPYLGPIWALSWPILAHLGTILAQV